MPTTKIARTVYCDVRQASLISQSAPYPKLDWQEVKGSRITAGNYYQAVLKVRILESQLVFLLKENANCWVKGQGVIASKDFYYLFSASFRLHRRLGELQNFDKNSYPILGDEYRWLWARYLAQQILGYTFEN